MESANLVPCPTCGALGEGQFCGYCDTERSPAAQPSPGFAPAGTSKSSLGWRGKVASTASVAAKKSAQVAGVVGAHTAERVRDYGGRAVERSKQSATSAQYWAQQQDWSEATQQATAGVKQTSKKVVRNAGVVASTSANAIRERGAKLAPASKYHPERVTPTTKVRGAPGVWLTWLTLGWSGVHRLAPQHESANSRAHFIRRLAVFILAVTATVIGWNVLVARLGAAPQEMITNFALDFTSGNVTGVDEALSEAKQNAIDYAVSTGAILGIMALALAAAIAYWVKDFFWVLKHTKTRKRENAQLKEQALQLRSRANSELESPNW